MIFDYGIRVGWRRWLEYDDRCRCERRWLA
jgi:hypothetical protein